MGTEKLKFKLELYATMWKKPPHVQILLNDKCYFDADGHVSVVDGSAIRQPYMQP